MTEKKLEQIVRLWQHRLGLERYDITVEFDVDEEGQTEGILGQCRQFADYDKATVAFNARLFPKWAQPEAHRVVAHELLHVLLRDLDYPMLKMLDGQVHRDVAIATERAHNHFLEQAIDRLAYRLVELAGVEA